MIDANSFHLETVKRILAALAPDCEVRAFGSRVTWTAKEYSDLDLALVGREALDWRLVATIKEAFAESDLPFRVDVLDWHSITPAFQKVIEKKFEVIQKGKAAHPNKAAGLPPGTTFPRGFPSIEAFRFPLIPARELFELKYGKALVEGNRRSGGIPVYGTNGRCGSHDRAMFVGPGVILGRKGQGPLGVEWSKGDYWVIDTAYSLAPLRPDVYLKFAYYLIKFIGLNHLKDGTSNPTLSRDSFGAQALPWPPPPDQNAIARILGALDDKIELNRRMNETLEATARALFKSWFVNCEFTADDWATGTLEGFASLNPESLSKDTRPNVINYIDLSNTKWGRIEAVACCVREAAPSRAQRVLRTQDTIVGTVRPGNGSYAFIAEEGLIGSTGFAVLRPKKPEYAEFIYLAATAAENIEALSLLADGGAYPAVRPEAVIATSVCQPDGKALIRFSKIVGPLLAKFGENERESKSLSALRDALLPKLLSGELRVRSAATVPGALA